MADIPDMAAELAALVESWSGGDIADYLGRPRTTVQSIIRRVSFPQPREHPASGPLWDASVIRAWALANPTAAGHPSPAWDAYLATQRT